MWLNTTMVMISSDRYMDFKYNWLRLYEQLLVRLYLLISAFLLFLYLKLWIGIWSLNNLYDKDLAAAYLLTYLLFLAFLLLIKS